MILQDLFENKLSDIHAAYQDYLRIGKSEERAKDFENAWGMSPERWVRYYRDELDKLEAHQRPQPVGDEHLRYGSAVPPVQEAEDQLDEIDRRGFLKGLGAAAGLAAMGGAKAADEREAAVWDPSWNKVGQKYDSSVTTNTTIKQTGNKQPEVIDRIADVKGPNSKGEYLVTVIHNNDIVSHYVTKNPPQNWMHGKHQAYPQSNRGVTEEQLDEKQDACYHKVKSRYKVWPSAYASGALVQCRKKGASNWGKKG